MAIQIWGATSLTGGGTGALDAIDGDLLVDSAIAFVGIKGANVRVFALDATSGAAESSPDIIAPDTNPGTKRWIAIDAVLRTLQSNLDANSKTITNATTIGCSNIVADIAGSTTKGVVITGAVSQSANLLDINSNGATGGDILTVLASGYVGIGETTPTSPLHVVGTNVDAVYSESTPTNTSQVNGLWLASTPLNTSNGTYIDRAGLMTVRPIIDSGVTNSGRFDGLLAQAVRNQNNGDAGTLAELRGLNVSAGHSSTGDSAPTTDKVSGMTLGLRASVGTITDLYAIDIPDTIGTNYTNLYGIYQQDTNSINYFAGVVGIGEAAPDYDLDVNGTFGCSPGSSVTPVDNGDVVIEATNNTTLTFKLKGSDGTVRSGTLTLS